MHGLRKSFLDENGCDADAVLREIVDLIGVSDLYSDNPYWENVWLSVLGKHSITFRNIFGLAPSLSMDELFLMRDEVLVNSRLTPHRAGIMMRWHGLSQSKRSGTARGPHKILHNNTVDIVDSAPRRMCSQYLKIGYSVIKLPLGHFGGNPIPSISPR